MCKVGSWAEMELNDPVEQFFEQGEHHVEFVISKSWLLSCVDDVVGLIAL